MMINGRWIIPLSYDKPPLNLNDRGHWATKDQHRKALRYEAAMRARSQIPRGLPHIHTRLFYRPPDRRRRDEDNLIATAKPCWDGIVDAGVVKDDTSEFMTKYMPKIVPPVKGKRPLLWLEVWTDNGQQAG